MENVNHSNWVNIPLLIVRICIFQMHYLWAIIVH